MREGIKKKAAAQRRKNKKLAKKDVTWKSRANKDPGIPASFPYKEEIIHELEQNRIAEKERKEQLRLKRQQEREAAMARGEDVEDAMMDEDEEPENQGGFSALIESAQQAAREFEGEVDGDEMVDLEEDVEYELSDIEDKSDIEKSRKAYDKIFKAVVDLSLIHI